ncbi:MAG TPA: hypothetical protein VJ999_04710 [Candidatus Sulfotelmatobacter sp.]|nr:hypothetical protein [Candidatus Sulfotelmatobacter sp.]
MKAFRALGISVFALMVCCGVATAQKEAFTAGTWTAVTKAPPSGVGHALLLTDGSVLVVNSGCSATGNWYRLVPDSTGSYIKGSWVSAGNLPAGYNPLYFASAVLPNADVLIMGGEYNGCNSAFTTKGAIYNPKTNLWMAVKAPVGWSTIGDASSIVLPNGHFMLANCCTTDEAIATLSKGVVTWTATGKGKADDNDEEGWTLLPNGDILTVDAYVGSYNSTGTNSEIYKTSAGTWSSAGSTIVQLWDSSASCGGAAKASYEVGPAILRPDGTVFYTGANRCSAGHTAIYDTATGVWSAGPDFPGALNIADGPAALLPDGNVLLDTSPGIYAAGSVFFEWDGAALNSVPGTPNAPVDSSYVGSMVLLPTGQVLFTDNSSSVQIYTPAGSPCTGCAPTISTVASTLTHGSLNNVIHGTQFNGMGQGSAYGDDAQQASNYPLVRITDASGAVVFCRTHSFNTMGVRTGGKLVAAQFDIPSTIALGTASLEVVTNGIASTPVAVTID